MGCTTSVLVPMVVDTPSIVTGPNGMGICPSGTLLIFATGANNYTWNPGGMTGSTTVVSPTVTSTYTVLGSSVTGCTTTTTRLVYVFPYATITLSASQSTLCNGNTTTLSVTGASQYTWFPGGIFQNSFSVVPLANTNYTVTGINFDGCTDTKTISLTVNPMPLLTVSSSTNVVCAGAVVNLSVNGASSYTWNPGGLTGQNILVAPIANTVYSVTGTLANCVDSQTIGLSVNPNPTISVTNATLCSGASTLLVANGASSYTWQPINLLGYSVNVMPFMTTTYTVGGIDIFGCSSTAMTTVVVNATPTLTAIANTTVICAGAAVNLSANGAATYSWNPGGLNGVSVTVFPSVSVTYSVVGSSTLGCIDTHTIHILVNANPTLSVQGTKEIICSGTTLTLLASRANTYTWNNSWVSNTFTSSPLVSTIYTVTGYSSAGCQSSYTIMQQVYDCTGILEGVSDAEELLVYPNPGSGQFNVSLNSVGQERFEVVVYNTLGQRLFNQTSEIFIATINLSEHANGTYFLLIHQKGKSSRSALIVKQ